MNILKKITIVGLLLLLQSNIANACGGDVPQGHRVLTQVLWGILLLIYLLPSIYYLLRFKRYCLSTINLLIAHLSFAILFLLSQYHYELGLNPFLNWLSHYISVTIIFMCCALVGFMLWIYPAIHTYSKGMQVRQRA